ncbi:protein of unknown function [bacterium A37T11]|nr:protein of unknown function [bacterium A37T11]
MVDLSLKNFYYYKKMDRNKFISYYFGLALALLTCSEEKVRPPNTGAVPLSPANVSIRNLPGSAIIHYTVSDDYTSYILAEYETKKGTIRTTKSSRYNDSLKVEGFAEAGIYDVTLYAVGEGEKRSEGVKIQVAIGEPPYRSVLKSIQLKATFGGVLLHVENPDTAALRIVLLTKESGNQKLVETFYVKSQETTLSSRGFESVKREFGVFVRDRFNNLSDTIYNKITPLFEQQLDKNKFKELNLDGDFNTPNNSSRSRLSNLWDGITGNGNADDLFATIMGHGFPQFFSFDLGIKANLSRFKYFPRSEKCCAYKNSPRFFEIWGSNVASGDWSHWTKLVDCEMDKPSGSPDGEYSSEDVAYVERGIDYEFPVGTPPFRYLRFKTLEVWASGNIAIYELTFFGSESVD